jgi:8-oxo-dGTP pyrophosphatase MutT (NUDIX family)
MSNVLHLSNYTTSYPEEHAFISKFVALLKHPRAFYRDHLPGHITGSAWIVNQDFTKVLLIEHAKLKRWLQPGGHADGEQNVINVALREAEEETGVKNLRLLSDAIFDLDIHPIPERKDFAAHDHYDVRYIFQADEKEELIISDESTGLKWVLLDDIEELTNSNVSMLRMKAKTIENFKL